MPSFPSLIAALIAASGPRPLPPCSPALGVATTSNGSGVRPAPLRMALPKRSSGVMWRMLRSPATAVALDTHVPVIVQRAGSTSAGAIITLAGDPLTCTPAVVCTASAIRAVCTASTIRAIRAAGQPLSHPHAAPSSRSPTPPLPRPAAWRVAVPACTLLADLDRRRHAPCP